MRFAAFFAGLLFATAALAGPPVTLRGPAPDVGLDFIHNAAIASGCGPTAASCITDTRASTKYCDFANGNWVSVGPNVPCITDKGLLVEDPSTNYLNNNSMTGAVPGSPGTPPTGWTFADRAGLSHTIVGVGTENGIDYIDYRVFGTTTSTTGGRNIIFQPDTTVPAVNGQNWIASFFVTLVGGTLNNVVLQAQLAEYNSGGVSLGSSTFITYVPKAGPLSKNRVTMSRLNTNALTAYEVFHLVPNQPTSVGLAIDYTLRIGWPQLERRKWGSETGNGFTEHYATSPIRTINGPVVRASDYVTLNKPPAFGSRYTMYAAATPTMDDGAVWFVEAIGPPTTYYNVFGIAVSGSPGTPKDALCFSNFDSGYSTNTWILGQPIKMACSAAPDGTSGNRILSLNGGDYINYSPDSYPYVPTLNTVVIGPDTQQVNGSGSFGGDTYIAAIGIWATVQLNADALKTITTPLPSPAPDVWLDFTDNAAIAPTIPGCGPTATSCLTDTRASSHTCDFTNGNWITVANNIPCITDKGLLVEDFATNGLRNSAAVGAVPGAPGTLPTFWADPLPFQGLSRNVVGTGTENGIDYVDVRYSGTPAPGFTFNLRHEVNPAPPIAVSTGQTWTASVFATLVGGTLAGVPTVTIGYQGFDVSHAFKESQITPVTLATGALGLSRKTFSFNITNAATKEIFSQVSFTVTTGVPVDFTVRVGWPQLERANQTIGVFATSPIRTTNAAITRAGDVVKMTRAPAFGAGYTMYVAGVPYAAAQAPLTLYGPGGSVRAYLNLSAGTGQAWLSGSDIYASTNSWTALQPYKLAIAAQPDGVSANLGMSLNGGGYAPPSAVYVTAPIALDTVKIGLDEWDDSASGYITQIGIWPNARLPDDALIGLTR